MATKEPRPPEAPQGDKPQDDKPQDDKPQDDKPQDDKPQDPATAPAAPGAPQSKGKKVIKALVRVTHNGETYEPGEPLDIGGKELQALLDVKAVEVA